MAVIIDIADSGKSIIQLLTDLIFESEGIRYPESKIKYGDVQVLDSRPNVLNDPNTFVHFWTKSDFDDRFVQGAGLMYRRRELASHFQNAGTIHIYTPQLTFKIHDVLDQINLYLTYPLTTADVLNTTVDASTVTTLELTANPLSYIWINSASALLAIHAEDKLSLLSQTDLDGFNVYVPA